MRSNTTGPFVAAPMLIALLSTAPALAQTLTPVEQNRSVQGSVFALSCGPDGDDQREVAPDFEPFSASVQAMIACESAVSRGAAEQRSTIGGHAIVAMGSADIRIEGETPGANSAMGRSDMSVTVRLDEPARFRLLGNIGARADGGDALFSGVRVTLTRGDGQSIASHEGGAAGAGPEFVEEFDDMGRIEPGVYELRAFGSSVADVPTDPNGLGNAVFDLSLAVGPVCAADIDGDGQATVSDFFAFVSAFAHGDPAADVNLDAQVDVRDFFAFVLAFRHGCE